MKSLPTWAEKLLRIICPEDLYEQITGDLMELYQHDVQTSGARKAKLKFVIATLRFVRPGILLRNRFSFHPVQTPMLLNYLKTTRRNILKSKLNFCFKLGGLVTALFSFLIIVLYVSFQYSFDRYHTDYQHIYRVNTERLENEKQEKYGIAPAALGPMIGERFPEVAAWSRLRISNLSHIRYNERVTACGVFPADSTFFDVLTFKFISGNSDALRKRYSIVLTRTLAKQVFGGQEPLHQVITMAGDGKQYEVTAVVEDMPANSHFRVEAFVPIAGESTFSLDNITSPVKFVEESDVLFLRLHQDADPRSLEEKLESLLDEHVDRKQRKAAGFKIFLQPLKDIYLADKYKYEFTQKGSTIYVYTFSALGIFLLVIASINYINLSIADLGMRSREIGVRKAMGAHKEQVAVQIILETLIYCMLSLALAIGMLYLFFPQILEHLEPHLDFGMLANKYVIGVVAGALLVVIFCSTAFPAYRLATSNAVSDLKGSNAPGYRSSFGKILLTTQFCISILCISATFIVGRQIHFIHTKDLGIDRKNLVVVTMPEDLTVKRLQTLKQEFKSIPGVVHVSNSSFRMGGGYWKDWYSVESGNEMKSVELYEVFSDDDLLKTLGLRLLDGRFFDASLPADSGAAFVINETAARELGWENPVGKRILTHPEEKGKWDGTVVGLVADINIGTLHEKVQPLVLRLPWQNEYPELFVYVRIDGPTSETVDSIRKKFGELFPGHPMELHFVDDFYNNRYQKENRAFASLQLGTVIVVLVSSLGIFSLSVYLSSRRMREFGIRKVLGATVKQIAAMHIWHFLRLAVLANLIALPVAYWLMREWLNGFAYRAELNVFAFLLVTLISLVLVFFSAGHAAWRAGRMNPVDVIKSQG